jgi:xylulokinase
MVSGSEYLLGIDVGTTNLKANLYDLAGQWVAGSTRPNTTHHPNPKKPGWSVYNPDELWNSTVENIREIVGKVSHPERIKALAIVGMGEPIIPIDENGDWLYPAICWFDRRTEPQVEWWRQNFGVRRIFDITGTPIGFFLSLNMMMWIRENEPEVFQRAHKWLLLEDYLIFKISGNFATDCSLATRTMGFDVRNKRWSDEIFRAAGLDIDKMAAVYPSGTPVGRVSKDVSALTGLAKGTIVATGGHDHGCATLAAKVYQEGSILNSTGTSDGIIGVMDSLQLTDEVYEAALPVYPHPLKNKYQVMDGLMFGAAAVDWYLERFGHEFKSVARKTKKNVYELLIGEADKTDLCSRGLFWLPNLRGLDTDPTARGVFLGIKESHTNADFIRAILEGICFEIRSHIDDHERIFQLEIGRIVVVGGTSQSDFWTQLRADITGRTVEALDAVEATSLGGAILAGLAAGIYSNYEEAAERIYRVRATFKPDPTRHKRFDWCYRNIYREIYPTLRELNARIAEQFPMME